MFDVGIIDVAVLIGDRIEGSSIIETQAHVC